MKLRSVRSGIGGAALATLLAAGGLLVTTAHGSPAGASGTVTASFTQTSAWSAGYEGHFTIDNGSGAAVDGWRLEFDLAANQSITSVWGDPYLVSGRHVTITNASWDGRIAAGASYQVGLDVSVAGSAAAPTGCLLNGAPCAGGAGTPPASGTPTSSTPTSSTPTSSAPTSSTPAAPASTTTAPAGTASSRVSPYVDVTAYPTPDLGALVRTTGLRSLTLAFVVSGSGCAPSWGGVTPVNDSFLSDQIAAMRSAGGEPILSFGGASGTELAMACPDATSLAAAYQQAIDRFGFTSVDFDIEQAAVADPASIDRRDAAIATLQQHARAAGKQLAVSYTLPVEPQGLTADGVNVLANARSHGVDISAVNVMAMDYGDWAAPSPAGKMGQYAIDAATATHDQLVSTLGLSDSAAWAKVGITPMIGVNDTAGEVFTLADAAQLTSFAGGKHVARLSFWSLGRDKACSSGGTWADPSCSGVSQQPYDFTRAVAKFAG